MSEEEEESSPHLCIISEEEEERSPHLLSSVINIEEEGLHSSSVKKRKQSHSYL